MGGREGGRERGVRATTAELSVCPYEGEALLGRTLSMLADGKDEDPTALGCDESC